MFQARISGVLQGANKAGVGGTVKRWHHQTGLHEIDAAAYIEMLEKEVEVLRDEFDDVEVSLQALPPRAPCICCESTHGLDTSVCSSVQGR